MKIFGRGKQDNDGLGGDDLDIVSDDAGFDDAEGGLAAPVRGFGGARSGSNKKFILLVVLVLLLGGGYAAMTMVGEEPPPPVVAALPPAEPFDAAAAPAPFDPNAPLPVDAAGMPLPADPLAGAIPPSMPGDPAMAAVPPMPEMPPMPEPLPTNVTAEVTGAPSTDAATAPSTATLDAIDAENGVDAAVAVAAVDAPPVPAGSAPGDAPAAPPPPAVAAVASETPAPVVPAGATGNIIVPARDPSIPARPTAVPAAPTPALDATAAAASDAELALIDNADLVPPSTETTGPRTPEEIAALWASLPTEPAMVRPLPQKYLTVKKESTAESLDSRLASARRALNDGRSAAALQFFNELRMDYPSDTRVLMGRAVALQRLGQNSEALAGYEEVLRADPKNLDALTNMLGLLKAQNPGLAVEKLLALRTVYPYNADITTQLAIAYGGAGDLNEALRYITLAEALKPESSYVLYNKAILYDRLGRQTEAGDMYRHLIRMYADGALDSTLPIESIKRRLAVLH